MRKLKNWFKLVWFNITIAFKKSSMKNLITRIENCLRTGVFSSLDNIQLKITPSTINGQVNQIICDIGMNNCRIGSIIIDITDVNNVKYEYELKTSDVRILQPLSDFANNLNQNKTNINGWIKKHEASLSRI